MISRRAVDVAQTSARIFSAVTVSVVNPLVYTNVRDIKDAAFRSWLLSYNVPRDISYDAVSLLRYESGAIVDGDGSYLVYSAGSLVSEQLPSWTTPSSGLIKGILDRATGAPSITDPCILVARYGDTTWGHWLLEMLPKIVIAEAMFPSRFRFVVPSRIFTPSQGVSAEYVAAVIGS